MGSSRPAMGGCWMEKEWVVAEMVEVGGSGVFVEEDLGFEVSGEAQVGVGIWLLKVGMEKENQLDSWAVHPLDFSESPGFHPWIDFHRCQPRLDPVAEE